MLKHLMNGGSLLSYALFDAESDAKAARDAQRADLLKNNTVIVKDEKKEEEKEVEEKDDEEADDEDDKEDDKEEDKEEDDKKEEDEQLTPEQIKEKEVADKIAAKAKRKEDRIQKRINDMAAQRDAANDKIKELEAKLAADPEARLTEEEVETRAEAKAAEKLRAAEIKKLQDDFDNDCEILRKAATKIDAKFDDKIADIAEQFGPIPSFLIGVLSDTSNGGEVLAAIAADDDLAEKIWDLKTKPAKMTKELLELSNKLIAANKKPKKEISKVEVITPLNSNNVKETVITDKDTKPENMQDYVMKRRAQMEQAKKARGY